MGLFEWTLNLKKVHGLLIIIKHRHKCVKLQLQNTDHKLLTDTGIRSRKSAHTARRLLQWNTHTHLPDVLRVSRSENASRPLLKANNIPEEGNSWSTQKRWNAAYSKLLSLSHSTDALCYPTRTTTLHAGTQSGKKLSYKTHFSFLNSGERHTFRISYGKSDRSDEAAVTASLPFQ